MAFIQGQNEDENQNQQGNAPLVGQGSSQVGSAGVSQAGTGAGGGGWTNIQAYLKANEGNTQSANALNKDVGSQFDQEKSGLESKASETKAQADAQNKAPSLDDAYNDFGGAGQQLKDYLNQAYGGPKTFDYGMGAKTQEYGDSLGSRDGFQGLMQGLYNRSAGGAMTTGQRSLQQQLDVNNPQLAQAQGDLSNQYKQLQALAGKTAGDVNSYLQNAETQRQAGQQDTRSQITSRADAAKAEADKLRAQRDTWNEAKYGNLDDAIATYTNQENRWRDFLGIGASQPTATGPKDAGSATQVTGGDNMSNMGETVDPWADQFTTVKKRRGVLDDLSGATGWVAPASNFVK